MSLRLLHGSKSTSPLLASTHLPIVTSHHNFRLPHSYSLAACHWFRYNVYPPKPPIPPDPPPSPRLVTQTTNQPLTPSLYVCNDVSPYLPAKHRKFPNTAALHLHLLRILLSLFISHSTACQSTSKLALSFLAIVLLIATPASIDLMLPPHVASPTTRCFPGFQQAQPPVSYACNGNRRLLIVISFPVQEQRHLNAYGMIRTLFNFNFYGNLICTLLRLVMSSSLFTKLRQEEISVRSEIYLGMGLFHLVMGYFTLDMQKPIKRMNPLLNPKSASTFNSSSAIHLIITATDAALLEFHHFTVCSDSLSLVSLLNLNCDLNELKSVLFDIRSLCETFSFTCFSSISRSTGLYSIVSSVPVV